MGISHPVKILFTSKKMEILILASALLTGPSIAALPTPNYEERDSCFIIQDGKEIDIPCPKNDEAECTEKVQDRDVVVPCQEEKDK